MKDSFLNEFVVWHNQFLNTYIKLRLDQTKIVDAIRNFKKIKYPLLGLKISNIMLELQNPVPEMDYIVDTITKLDSHPTDLDPNFFKFFFVFDVNLKFD